MQVFPQCNERISFVLQTPPLARINAILLADKVANCNLKIPHLQNFAQKWVNDQLVLSAPYVCLTWYTGGQKGILTSGLVILVLNA